MRLTKFQFFVAILMTGLLGCTSAPNNEKDHLIESPEASHGLWLQQGYGRILELNDSTITVFDLNKTYCMLTFKEDILDFAQVLGVRNDTLLIQHGIDIWKCVKIDALPELCSRQPHELDRDPLLNYDLFWMNFKEHYCSFEIKNIDWDELNTEYRPKITDNTSDVQLYAIFRELMAKLEDGHVKLSAPDAVEDEYDSTIDQASKKYNMLDVFETGEALAKLYVDSLRSFNAGMTRWGMIGQDVGYVQINSMLMQADYDLDEGLTLMEFEKPYWFDNVSKQKDEIHRQQEAAGMKKTLGKIMADLALAKSFIIDLRFNGGGKDGVAMEIVSHFSSFKGTMAKKSVYENGRYVNPQTINNTPSPVGFNGPVYLLTSHETASASELLVLCSIADSQFSRIGSTTEGIFSSTLDKVLPNGWSYEFSNEVYTDLHGTNYEDIGIPPHIDLNYPEDKDSFIGLLKQGVESGADPAIAEALSRI